MHLQTDVFTTAEGTADTAEGESHPLDRQIEARSDLLLVFVQPLCCDEQFNP